MNSFNEENVTTRRPNRCNSENDITGLEFDNTSDSIMLFEQTLESLPNMSSVENTNIMELKQKNEELTVKLESAHTEIENLLSENYQLKSELKKCQMLVKTLKQLSVTGSCEPRSNNSTPRRKTSAKSVQFKPLHDVLSSFLNNLKQNSTTGDTVNGSTRKSVIGETNNNNEKNKLEENKVTQDDTTNIYCSKIDTQNNVYLDKINNINHNTSQHIQEELGPKSSFQHFEAIVDDDKRINDVNPATNVNKEASIANGTTTRKKIIIIGDQYGKNIREISGNLLGPEYQVYCFLKPGGESNEVLKVWKDEVSSLSLNDCVVLIVGSNDRNPFNFKSNMLNWAATCQNTNVIIAEVPRNDYLNLVKLNYELKFICSKYKQMTYVDMGYSRSIPRKQHFALNLARSLLKEILCIGYKQNYLRYKNNIRCSLTSKIFKCDKECQTEVNENDNINKKIIITLRNDATSQTDFASLNNNDDEQLEDTNGIDNSLNFFREQ